MFMGDRNISSSVLKKIRNDLGIKQKDLKCPGVQNISRLENGQADMTYTVANRLYDKINEIIKEKRILLDYDISIDLLLGKTNILEDSSLIKLEKNASEEVVAEIIEIFINLNFDEAIDFMLKAIDIVNKDIYKNADVICDFCYKLLAYNISIEARIDMFNNIIRAHYTRNRFDIIVNIGKSFIHEISMYASPIQKEVFFSNMASSYFQIKNYKECEKYLDYIKVTQSKDHELYFLLLRATCNSMRGYFDNAIKIYKNIIFKGEKTKQYDYVANSYSDLCDIYLDDDYIDKDVKLATIYIEKSLNLIPMCTNKQFIVNCYYHKFLQCIVCNSYSEIKCFFNTVMNLAIDIEDKSIQNKVVIKIFKYMADIGALHKSQELFSVLKSLKYTFDDSTIITILTYCNDEKTISKIAQIVQSNSIKK